MSSVPHRDNFPTRNDLILLERTISRRGKLRRFAIDLYPRVPTDRSRLLTVILGDFGRGVFSGSALYACFDRGVFLYLPKSGELAVLFPNPLPDHLHPSFEQLVQHYSTELDVLLNRFADRGIPLDLGRTLTPHDEQQ